MLRTLGLVVMFSAGIVAAEEANSVLDRPTQTEHRHRGFHPLRSIQHLHDGLVNGAIGMSSIGIEQPKDRLDEMELRAIPKSFVAEIRRPACANPQLTAMVLPQ